MPGFAPRCALLLAAAALAACGGEDEESTAPEPAFSDAEVVEAIGFQERESLIEGQEVPGYEATNDATCSIDEVLNDPDEVAEAEADPVNDSAAAGKPGLMTSPDGAVGATGAPFFKDCRRQIQDGLDTLEGG